MLTIVGIVVAIMAIVISTVMDGNSFGALIGPSSMFLVVVGAFGVTLAGFEMQKALPGVTDPEDPITITVFDNDQNMPALAERIQAAWEDRMFTVPGFLIRGHGLYAWGRDLSEAQRHTEGFEFLLDCAWREQLVPRP